MEMNSELKNKIEEGAKLIRKGKLVAFPTETVYGLGADALSSSAVESIFRIKKRPFNDPLIVHIADIEDLEKIAKDVPEDALLLMRIFWPGPLTFILKKTCRVPDIVTAGLDTVAVRMPAHPAALGLIKASETPIAAPSANPFGRPSPTTALHVREDFKDKLGLIIDGGSCDVGLESTILDTTSQPFSILRPGGVTDEEITAVIGNVCRKAEVSGEIKAPGTMKRHYAPEAKLILVERSPSQTEEMESMAGAYLESGKRVGVILTEENRGKFDGCISRVIGGAKDLKGCARNLFSILRELDSLKSDVIIAEGIAGPGLGRAIMDRLRRGSAAPGS